MQHPAVVDAAVIGVPDDRAGELPRAYVVLKPDTKASVNDIADFVKSNHSEVLLVLSNTMTRLRFIQLIWEFYDIQKSL